MKDNNNKMLKKNIHMATNLKGGKSGGKKGYQMGY
jgi:hypothetical protein